MVVAHGATARKKEPPQVETIPARSLTATFSSDSFAAGIGGAVCEAVEKRA
jgi:hypothetical protein